MANGAGVVARMVADVAVNPAANVSLGVVSSFHAHARDDLGLAVVLPPRTVNRLLLGNCRATTEPLLLGIVSYNASFGIAARVDPHRRVAAGPVALRLRPTLFRRRVVADRLCGLHAVRREVCSSSPVQQRRRRGAVGVSRSGGLGEGRGRRCTQDYGESRAATTPPRRRSSFAKSARSR